jgi:hypothetical protein
MSNYDFDEQDKYIEFTLNGNLYQFWYPTVEQSIEAQKLGNDPEKTADFMFMLVKKPEGATYPDFREVQSQMNLKQMAMFKQMIDTELGVA